MSDTTISLPEPIEVPVRKVSALIGDGEGILFSVDHPAAPNVITALYRAVGGQEVPNLPERDRGKVVYAFSTPPGPNEYIAVVIG